MDTTLTPQLDTDSFVDLPGDWVEGDSNLKWIKLDLPKFPMLEELEQLLGNDFYIFGGAIRDYYLLGHAPQHDFDLYIEAKSRLSTPDLVKKLGFEYVGEEGQLVGATQNDYIRASYGFSQCITKVDQYKYQERDVQIISCTDLLEVFSTFDWRICQFGYSSKDGFFATVGALKDARDKVLRLAGVHLVIKTILRGKKLADRLNLSIDPYGAAVLSRSLADSLAKWEEKKSSYGENPHLHKDLQGSPYFKRLAKMTAEERAAFHKAEQDEIKSAQAWTDAHKGDLQWGDLSESCRKVLLPNLFLLIPLIEGWKEKETTPFERSLVCKRSDVELSALEDFSVFRRYVEGGRRELKTLINSTLKMTWSNYIHRSGVDHSSFEPFEKCAERLCRIEKYLDTLQGLTLEQFRKGKFDAPYWSPKIGKGLFDCMDMAQKTRIVTFRATRVSGEEVVQDVLISTGELTNITAHLEKAAQFFITRAKVEREVEKAQEKINVSFVVSNDVKDLLTISHRRAWTSCQSLGYPTSYNRSLSANVKNTLVAYLANESGVWIGRVLLRLDLVQEQVFIEPYYGDQRYRDGLVQTVQAYLQEMKVTEMKQGVVSGFDCLPYSDTGTIDLGKDGPSIRYSGKRDDAW